VSRGVGFQSPRLPNFIAHSSIFHNFLILLDFIVCRPEVINCWWKQRNDGDLMMNRQSGLQVFFVLVLKPYIKHLSDVS